MRWMPAGTVVIQEPHPKAGLTGTVVSGSGETYVVLTPEGEITAGVSEVAVVDYASVAKALSEYHQRLLERLREPRLPPPKQEPS